MFMSMDPMPRGTRAPPIHFAWAAALVAGATGACALGRPVLALPDLVMIYLLAIVVGATFLARGPSLLVTALSVGAYDFFFIPPYFTFDVADGKHLLTFVTMFVVGLLVSGLTLRLRRQAEERERLGEEAKAASLRARTEELRSSLLSAVSHDLRTPLAAITGAATALRSDVRHLGRADHVDLVETICEEAERLERLLANLLDMTRLESGALRVRCEWVPLDEIVGAAIDRVEPRLGARPVEVEIAPGLPLLWTDPVILEQVFVNLLENAAKYTPPGSPLALRARASDREISIVVADRGPGIATGDEERIFDKFHRGTHPGISGAGLGLAICRGIATAFGGRIVARNRAGGGAEFEVALPLREGAPAAPPTEADVVEVGGRAGEAEAMSAGGATR